MHLRGSGTQNMWQSMIRLRREPEAWGLVQQLHSMGVTSTTASQSSTGITDWGWRVAADRQLHHGAVAGIWADPRGGDSQGDAILQAQARQAVKPEAGLQLLPPIAASLSACMHRSSAA